MSSTQVSQTLFRFVNVRSPQLTDDVGKDKRFVYRSDEVKNQTGSTNVFDAAVAAATGTKWAALTTAATAFKASSAFIGTETALETFIGSPMYKFSTWLARNRDSFTNAELLSKAANAGAVLTTDKLTGLWNNLFYQVITQQFFYIKESIIQLLIANHTIANLDTRPEEPQAVVNNITHAKATVVLPRDLFLENDNAVGFGNRFSDDTTGTPPGSSTFSPAAISVLKKQLITANARFYNDKYAAIVKKIKQIQKDYSKEYQAAYTTAFQEHEAVLKPLIQEYKADIETAKATWCAARPNGRTYDANDPCSQPPYIPEPTTLPEFTFSFQSETEYLASKLDDETITLINNLAGIDSEGGPIIDHSPLDEASPSAPESDVTLGVSSFDTIYANFNSEIEQNYNTIIGNTTVFADKVIVIAGMVFPALNAPATVGTCQNFVATTASFHTRTEWFLRIVFENKAVNITNAYYEAKIGSRGPAVQSDTYIANIDGDYYTIFSGVPLLQITSEISNGFILKGSFTLADRDTYLFEVNMAPNYAGGIDKLTGLYNLIGEGTMCKETTGGGGGDEETSTVFKPSGFGLKQLGIADYKKVEQTVHCYVEGEVAHIENIMAREYKEKSTRSLRRSENTTTVSSESESEHLSDTTSTDRFEMQNEVAKVIQDSKDFSANANAQYQNNKIGITISAGANFATHNSKEQSTRAAITEAKEITQRAMDRVVTRVKQERIEKIIDEFEENNKHGFDNTKGDKHVVGVYRWVDKIYKNQIYNYGKRLMFEFMIPEPSKLHRLGMIENVAIPTTTTLLEKPIDPRTIGLRDASALNEYSYKSWAAKYDASVNPCPLREVFVGKSLDYNTNDANRAFTKSDSIDIPDGYLTNVAQINFTAMSGDRNGWTRMLIATVGNVSRETFPDHINIMPFLYLNQYQKSLPVTISSTNLITVNVTINVSCLLSSEGLGKWQLETFDAIIKAYEDQLDAYNKAIEQNKTDTDTIIGTNPGFYRDIEQLILRKNCLSYLMDQSPTAKLTYGKKMYKDAGKDSFTGYEVDVTKALDDYAAFIKFMEQAFEWNIMSYYFYPFYWGNRADWSSLYQYDNNDPIFRSFMQSGMARVVVTVRPGFEDAVRFYLQTGLIWNGGEVPVIDDPMHLSIVDELKEPLGKPEGKAWATRIPTSLTILQADSIGLRVDKALPCNCEDVNIDTWENPDTVPCGDNFVVTQDILNGGETTPVGGDDGGGSPEGDPGGGDPMLAKPVSE